MTAAKALRKGLEDDASGEVRRLMIRALARLERGAPAHLPESLEAFGIAGSERHGIQRLFLSHPPIAERIDALQRG